MVVWQGRGIKVWQLEIECLSLEMLLRKKIRLCAVTHVHVMRAWHGGVAGGMANVVHILLPSYFRLNNHGIMVSDLTDKNRPPPNPVTTFEQAFGPYRKSRGFIVFVV